LLDLAQPEAGLENKLLKQKTILSLTK